MTSPFKKFVLRKISKKSKRSSKTTKKKTSIKHDYWLGNKRVSKAKVEKHIKGMYIAPAYDNVYINLDKSDKVWAIGEDDKGRKQYIYNKEFVKARGERIFSDLKKFGDKFDKIEKTVSKDLKSSDTNKKQIAMVLTIMKKCNFRIGNAANVKKYKSYGVTTLEKRHVKKKKAGLTIDFVGKKGVRNVSTVNDNMVKKFLQKRVKEIKKNETLFEVTSKDVNGYLKQFDECFSSKKLRTFNANLILIENLKECDLALKPKKSLKAGIVAVAEELHNTPAICKKSYLDPKLMNFFLDDPAKFSDYFEVKNVPKKLTSYFKKNY